MYKRLLLTCIFIGYAIIQLPEFLLFLRKGLSGIIWNGSLKKRTEIKPKPTTDNADINEKIEAKVRPLVVRISMVEQKLDEIMTKIHGLKY